MAEYISFFNMNEITSLKEKKYNSIESDDIESNININNNLYEFHLIFKKSIIQLSLIIIGFMFIFFLFYEKNDELLKSNKYNEKYISEYDTFCSFKSILFKLSIISLVLFMCLGIIIVNIFFDFFLRFLCNLPIVISSS